MVIAEQLQLIITKGFGLGDNSCLRGRGFELQHHILDGDDFFTLICCKKCIVCLKRPKINETEDRAGQFLKN